jgi:DNA invertase Pin-like site-specific DNA recombinase
LEAGVSGVDHDGLDCLGIAGIKPGLHGADAVKDRRVVLLADVLNLVHELEQRGAGLRVREPEFCISTDTGRILVTVLGMVAEMKRRFIWSGSGRGSRPRRQRASTRAVNRPYRSRRCAGSRGMARDLRRSPWPWASPA